MGATTFIYNPLPTTSDHIRLLAISRQQDGSIAGKLEQHCFANKPVYEVLSIAKEDRDGASRDILVNGSPLAIPEYLYHALQDVGEGLTSRCIWVEDICVNMRDVFEKNQQRGIMYLTYSRAQRVNIWLGVPEHAIIRDGDTTGFGRYSANHHASKEIAASPYWKQAWSIQDIGLAGDLNIYFGTYCFTWQEFRSRVMHSSEEMKKNVPVVLERKLTEYERQSWTFDVEEEIQKPLEALLEEYKNLQCVDPGDGIFAFLSLASDWSDDTITVDYEMSLYELFTRAIHFQQTRMPLNTQSYDIRSKSLDRSLRLMKFSQLVQHILGDGIGAAAAESDEHSDTFHIARGALCSEVQLLGPSYRQCISSARTNATWKKNLEAHLRTSNKELLKARESNDKYSYIFPEWSESYARKIEATPTTRSFGYQTSAVDVHPEKEEGNGTGDQPKVQPSANERGPDGPVRFLGTNGILGFLPPETQVGDSIYTFWDCDIAVVLRKAGPDRWTIVGRADLAPTDKSDREPNTIWHDALMLDVEKLGRGYTVGVGETFPYMMNFKLDLATLQQLTT